MSFRRSSEPFLSIEYFRSISDLALDENFDPMEATKKMDDMGEMAPVILVKSDLLFTHLNFLLSLDRYFVLITVNDDDVCMPYFRYPTGISDRNISDVHRLLDGHLLIRWYTKNPCIVHDKISPLPLGPKWQFGEDRTPHLELFNRFLLTPQQNLQNANLKTDLLYSNFSVETTDDPFYERHRDIRRSTRRLFQDRGFTFSENRDFESYLGDLSRHKFCLSPPGRGIDTYRTWEALMSGTVPIVLSSPLDSLYRGLPVIIAKDYSAITREFLEESHRDIVKRRYDFSVLYTPYWDREFSGQKRTLSNVPIFWTKWLGNFYNRVATNSYLRDAGSSDRVAVIVEPRKHPLLKYVIYNFMHLLHPHGWHLHIFCGTDNVDFIDLVTRNLPCNVTVLSKSDMNEREYNSLLTDADFYRSLTGQPRHVLIFQSDCILFDGRIDRFLDHDFVGAPWMHSPQLGCNGGLSLRNCGAMIRICEDNPWTDGSEDGYFTFLNAEKLKIPGFAEKARFSMETIWSDEACGTHKAYAYQDHVKLKRLLDAKWSAIFGDQGQAVPPPFPVPYRKIRGRVNADIPSRLSDYRFFASMDCMNKDVDRVLDRSPAELARICDTKGANAFNTLGYIKCGVEESELIKSPYMRSNDGIYIKQKPTIQ